MKNGIAAAVLLVIISLTNFGCVSEYDKNEALLADTKIIYKSFLDKYPDIDERNKAVYKITDQKLLIAVAYNDKESVVRDSASYKVDLEKMPDTFKTHIPRDAWFVELRKTIKKAADLKHLNDAQVVELEAERKGPEYYNYSIPVYGERIRASIIWTDKENKIKKKVSESWETEFQDRYYVGKIYENKYQFSVTAGIIELIKKFFKEAKFTDNELFILAAPDKPIGDSIYPDTPAYVRMLRLAAVEQMEDPAVLTNIMHQYYQDPDVLVAAQIKLRIKEIEKSMDRGMLTRIAAGEPVIVVRDAASKRLQSIDVQNEQGE